MDSSSESWVLVARAVVAISAQALPGPRDSRTDPRAKGKMHIPVHLNACCARDASLVAILAGFALVAESMSLVSNDEVYGDTESATIPEVRVYRPRRSKANGHCGSMAIIRLKTTQHGRYVLTLWQMGAVSLKANTTSSPH